MYSGDELFVFPSVVPLVVGLLMGLFGVAYLSHYEYTYQFGDKL